MPICGGSDMKKFFIAAVFSIFATCIFSSCSFIKWLSDDWLTKNQKEITDAAMERLCSAVSARDAAAVKAEFSLEDIGGVAEFDDEAQKLIDYITGEDITFERKASGSDGAAMGGYPREREFGGVRYNIETTTDSYKVIFGYRSYYSESENKLNTEKIGFIYFDIINVENDRECPDRLYSGCPLNCKGINFDYKTNYLFCPEEYGCRMVFCEKSDEFEPIIINDVTALNAFYDEHEVNMLESNGSEDKDFANVYDDEFFIGNSLYVAGKFNEDIKCCYVPQYLYVGDFVLVAVAGFGYDPNSDDNASDYANGAIMFIEIPEKVADEISTSLDLSIV